MTLDALLQFLRGDIKMSHIYQPVLIRTLLDSGGSNLNAFPTSERFRGKRRPHRESRTKKGPRKDI
jgi:hypothetical protein